MASQYSIEVLKIVVAQICQTIGWHAIQSTPLNIMVDILHKYIMELGKNSHSYAEHFSHTSPNLDDVGLAFRDAGVRVEDLSEYIANVENVQFPHVVPKYPVPRDSHLNFLKPGSREVLTRPVHVHEHLPPMHPELEEEEKMGAVGAVTPLSVEISVAGGAGAETPSPASPKSTTFKRPGDPDHHSAKRVRLMMEEEGRPLREISSVMMTTSGFLSPAREGKLPEARTPATSTDPSSRSASPIGSPSSYPTVPPDVKGDKKAKKVLVKKSPPDAAKKIDREEKDYVAKKKDVPVKPSETIKTEKGDEPKVKKLVSMKEFAKLKALKVVAMKQMAAIVPSPNLSGLGKIPKIGANRSAEVKSPKGKLGGSPKGDVSTGVSPPPAKNVSPEKVRDGGLVEGKLSSEPDKQKLNIFKKISKVKEDKMESGDVTELVAKDSRESSPGLVIDESELNSRRDSRMAKIDTCIDAVIHKAAQGGGKELEEGELPLVSDSTGSESEMPVDYDSSQGSTPSLPRTPEVSRRKEKERKKKRDRSKSRKKMSSPRKPKAAADSAAAEVSEVVVVSRPKTPEVHEVRPPVFPFFTHFPPVPGLIPPPIGHPYFPGFPLPMGKNMPHPAMPNMPMPPARFMQRIESPDTPAPAPVPTPAPPALLALASAIKAEAVKTEVEVKQPHIATLTEKTTEKVVDKTPEKTPEKGADKTPDKLPDKKQKEHKREKKEKDKTKKKKEKKDKLKGKERGEKKKTKEEKREKNKSKEKKEKKEKRKEKERDEKMEGSVPKITLRLNPSSPRPPTPDVQPPVRRITIKPVVKTPDPSSASGGGGGGGSGGLEPVVKRDPSPELARMCALVTRPAKKSSSKGATPVRPEPIPSSSSSAPTPLSSLIDTPPLVPASSKPAKPVKVKVESDDLANDRLSFYHDNSGNKVWICPACRGQDDGSPMIGCDDCDAWYHWVCVGIQVPPDENEDWYCRVCIVKKQEHVSDKSKKKRKKKLQAL